MPKKRKTNAPCPILQLLSIVVNLLKQSTIHIAYKTSSQQIVKS